MGLNECKNILLNLDNAFVKVSFISGEERLEIGGVYIC